MTDLAVALDRAGDPLEQQADASASGCTWAPLPYLGNCIWVDGDGTTVDAIYAGAFGTQICNGSVWIYAVYPSGSVQGLDWESTGGCRWSAMWSSKIYSNHRHGGKYFPHGTRICVEFKVGGSAHGGEPCITVKR